MEAAQWVDHTRDKTRLPVSCPSYECYYWGQAGTVPQSSHLGALKQAAAAAIAVAWKV